MLKKRPLEFPTDKTIRVIADTDCNCECDDQFCIAHMLMTPRFDVRGIIAEHYNEEESEQKSYEEIQRIAELMGLKDEVRIFHGAKVPMKEETVPVDSDGARFIIEEAMREDERPLFVCGPRFVSVRAGAVAGAYECVHYYEGRLF